MERELRVLILEDSPADAELAERELRKAGLSFSARRVETREAFAESLAEFAPDLILADYALPSFDGLSALLIAQERSPLVPFIFVSGSIGEELAIETLKSGATDYVLKHGLARLGPAVRRALGEAAERAERRRAEAALRESEERYALAVRGAHDGLWDWDLRTNQVYFSPRWKAMLSYQEDEIAHHPDEWLNRVHPEDIHRVRRELDLHLAGAIPHFETEYRMRNKEGDCCWMLSRGLAVRDAAGRAYRLAGSQTDITRRRQAEEQLRQHALYDRLTGLPNRALFLDRLRRTMEFKQRDPDYSFATLFLDLDRFRLINDSFRHSIGDKLLIIIAHRLKSCLRPGDSVARLGGDEFAILLEEIQDSSVATQMADRIQAELRLPFKLGGQEAFITASIGITLGTADYERPEDLLRDAETAMYRAKAQGKACAEVFDLAMHGHLVGRLQLEFDLRKAIAGQELQVYYQPIVSLAGGQMTGVEALLRWPHPERGFIPPAEFIPLAEETGLIAAINAWVLQTACAHHQAWQRAGFPPLRLAVNFSAYQFERQNPLALITEALTRTKVSAETLELEITETKMMKDIAGNAAALQELQATGVRISIDDFGTGYSSLAYLKRLPIHTLKIDRSFVEGITEQADDAAITSAIIAMAHSLKLKVIAEGVETERQVAFLRERGCDEAQGYFFSRPVPAEAVPALWSNQEAAGRALRLAER
jgi:diguanylate cyclase (GGDEF)-like protein/PAS domain S-box-containing protein